MDRKEFYDDLRQHLFESANDVYDRQEDTNIPKKGESRKKVLTLKDLNTLKKMRNTKREELAQQSVYVPYLYGPQEQQPGEEGGDLGAGLGL